MSGGPVWIKRVGDANIARANVEYTAGFDVAGRAPADERLARHDLQTNAAHLLMLVETNIITVENGMAIASGLLQLREKNEMGESFLRPSCEDIHMSSETVLGELIGSEHAGRLHSARSRNDQVATDMRLWLRDEVAGLAQDIAALAERIADHALKHTTTVCPGFTHGQPAMITTWGHWTMSYLPRLLRDIRALGALLRELKTCPLGAAASYGTSWPIDRVRTTKLLGFKHPTPSGADGIWSRGELELRFAQVAAQFLSHLSGIAQDLILLSSPPRDWIRLASEHVTGSSIMPQKRTPDFAEVTRARAHVAAGIAQSLAGIGIALQSGYNRDTQWTKYLVFDAADNVRGAAELFAQVFDRMEVNAAPMKAACAEGFLNATDVADHLSGKRGVPFRVCYRVIGEVVRECDAQGAIQLSVLNEALTKVGIAQLSAEEWRMLEDPEALLAHRTQAGNPAPTETGNSIALLTREIREEAGTISAARAEWQAAMADTWKQIQQLSG
ncbi:argininosuccinate lyase [Candidatus Sumerlaeota bacterium]|nr:argininosuccinate lyase [Candidatus Sumerlaeota bacterium]